MHFKVFATMAVGLALSACADSLIKEKMKPYIGQPASVLISKLGYPARQDEVAGRKVYIWSTANFVDGTNYACTIRAIVDAGDIVNSWDLQGNEGGCERYALMLMK